MQFQSRKKFNEYNENLRNKADRLNESAQLLCLEIERLQREANERKNKYESDTKNKFRYRDKEIQFWIHQLNNKLADLSNENSLIEDEAKKLLCVKDGLCNPFNIAKACLKARQKLSENMEDDVTLSLLNEIKTYEKIDDLLEDFKIDMLDKLRVNRKFEFEINQDINQKVLAKIIDSEANEYAEENLLFFKKNKFPENEMITSYEDWLEISRGKIDRSDQNLDLCRKLRHQAIAFLNQIHNDVHGAFNKTSEAFERSKKNLLRLIEKLETRSRECLEEILNLESRLDEVDDNLRERKASYETIKAKLEKRRQRPNFENVNDEITESLLNQLNQLKDDIINLEEQRRVLDSHAKKNRSIYREINQDVEDKREALYIDDVICKNIRNTFKLSC